MLQAVMYDVTVSFKVGIIVRINYFPFCESTVGNSITVPLEPHFENPCIEDIKITKEKKANWCWVHLNSICFHKNQFPYQHAFDVSSFTNARFNKHKQKKEKKKKS